MCDYLNVLFFEAAIFSGSLGKQDNSASVTVGYKIKSKGTSLKGTLKPRDIKVKLRYPRPEGHKIEVYICETDKGKQ